jgi:4a-hydroxytetrahydrobiopterin dehydratase
VNPHVPDGWAEVEGALQRQFSFRDFADVLALVNGVGEAAEAENHHPDVAIHWNKVTLRWWTGHTPRAASQRDTRMAERSAELAAL